MTKKVVGKSISTSERRAEHPFAGQNTQPPSCTTPRQVTIYLHYITIENYNVLFYPLSAFDEDYSQLGIAFH